MHHVQNSEETLEKKRKHCMSQLKCMFMPNNFIPTDMDVIKAFESALALLNDRVKP